MDLTLHSTLPAEVAGVTRWLFNELCGLLDRQAPLIEQVFGMAAGGMKELGGGREHAVMRVSRYHAPAGRVIGAAHKDMDLLTLLPPATSLGLEIGGSVGWVSMPVPPGTVLIMSGELLEAVAGTPAAVHRVVSPGGDRLSVSLFLNARPDLRLASGESAAEVLRRRLDDIST